MIIFQASGIGNRIETWLKSTDFGQEIVAYKDRVYERIQEFGQMASIVLASPLSAFASGQILSLAWYGAIYVFFGIESAKPQSIADVASETADELAAFQADPQEYLQRRLNEFGTSPQTVAFTEFIGTIITEPVVSLLETYAGQENPDPHAMARSFHGIASGLPWAAESFDSILRTILGNRAPSVGKQIMALYWGLGLGFLGWQTLAPLLSSGLQPNLDRYYKNLYRPERFSPAEMRDLLALEKITEGEFLKTMREQGWRDQDIQTWLDLKYRQLSEGNLWKLREEGEMSDAEVERRLKAHGYDPADIPLLFKTHPLEEEEDTGKFLTSTAKKAYRNHLIDATEFREIQRTLGRNEREIELQLQLLDEERETELQELTVSQIRQLFLNGLIDDREADHHLEVAELSPAARERLVELWTKQALPKAARLNRGTITEAYREGVIDRDRASTLLQSESGYSSEQAEIILKTQDAILQRAASGVATGPRAISLAMLRDFAQAGIITRSEAEQRKELEKFAQADRPLVVEWLFFGAFEEGLTLGPDQLGEAYAFGLIAREELLERLLALGVVEEDAEIFIQSVELNNPEVFGEFVPRYAQVPSVSQLDKALVRGIIDEEEYRDRLSRLGYNEDGIDILLFNAQYQTPKEPRKLTKAETLNLYEKGKFTRGEALNRLVVYGYTMDDAELLIEGEEVAPEDTEAAQWYFAGYIELGPLLAIFTELGYEPDEIQAFVDRFG